MIISSPSPSPSSTPSPPKKTRNCPRAITHALCPFQSDKGSLYLEGLRSDPALCVVHPQDGGDGDGQDWEGEHHRHHCIVQPSCVSLVSP